MHVHHCYIICLPYNDVVKGPFILLKVTGTGWGLEVREMIRVLVRNGWSWYYGSWLINVNKMLINAGIMAVG